MVIEGHDVRARSTDGSLSLAPCHDSQVAVGPVLDDDIFISSLGEALSSILITSAGSADVVRSPAGTVQQRPVAQPWVHDSLDPENLIQRALHERDPLLYIPYVPCRRRRAKTSPDLASVIKNLRKNPRYVTWKISGSALKEARDEFVARYAIAACQSIRVVRTSARRIFHRQDVEFKKAWFFLKQCSKHMFLIRPLNVRQLMEPHVAAAVFQPRLQRPLEQKQYSIEACALFVSWHSSFGVGKSVLVKLLGSGCSNDELLHVLMRTDSYRKHFELFRDRVRYLAMLMGLSSWGSCMDLTLAGASRGRVQLHAVFAPRLASDGQPLAPTKKVYIPVSDLVWDGIVPDIRPAVCGGRTRQLTEALAGGFYYVLCNKIGGMYKASSVELFKDPYDGLGEPM